ncbi:MAG: hypothetical protein IRY91_03980 [Gemmatimonadaceae bacterium]|nr:hypothetical protein [Gemmatimonadaceae bacterium]
MSLPLNAISRPHPARRDVRRGWLAVLPMLIALGCAGDAPETPPPVTDPARIYWTLTLDYHAVTLSTVAPYDTIQLTATPRTPDGTPLAGLPAPTFESLDRDRAEVSADGLVHAIKSGTQIPVVATLTVGNLRHADTVLINVTDEANPPVLATLSIQPDSGDSAKTAINVNRAITTYTLAADGSPITGLAVYYTTRGSDAATIDRATGLLFPVHPGHVTIVASATAYGVTKTDSLRYTIGYSSQQELDIVAQVNASGQTVGGFSRPLILLGPGGRLIIVNQTNIATDLTFDDPTNIVRDEQFCVPPFTLFPYLCEDGNVEAFANDPNDPSGASILRFRRFPVPGTYRYHSTIFGTAGTIVVVDESTLP